MSCKKNGNSCYSKFLFIAGVFAGAYYIIKNYDIKIKLVRKNKGCSEGKEEAAYVPEYVEIENTYVTEYASENFSQELEGDKNHEPEIKVVTLEKQETKTKETGSDEVIATEKEEEKEDASEGIFFQKL